MERLSCSGHINWLSRVALSISVSGNSPSRGTRWHLMADAAVFLRLSERLRSRAMRWAYHSNNSPVVLHVETVDPTSAATRKRTAGSAAITCLVLKSGKLPILFQERLLSRYQEPRARLFA
ncbi:hypothetical protein D3C85_1626750 [compost metagenome]